MLLVFLDTAAAGMVLGGLYWGVVANPDPSLLEPLLSLDVAVAALILAAVSLLAPPVGAAGRAAPGAVLVSAMLFPGFFVMAAAPPFLCALAFPEEKGTGRGFFTLASLSFATVAAGLFLGALQERYLPGLRHIVLDVGVILLLALSLWLWLTRQPRDPEETPLRFFPVRSMGYWTGDKVYGQELLVSGRVKRTLAPASFLGALAAGYAVLQVATAALPWEGGYPMEALILPALALATGALVLGPLLAAAFPPMIALSLDLLIMSVFLAGPLPDAAQGGIPALGVGLAMLATAGALFPLSMRVGVSRQDFLAYSLGKIDFHLAAGFFLGLTLALAGEFDLGPEGFAFGAAALIASFLAAGPTLSWTVSAFLAAGVGILYYLL
jgi:hypothetical protein